MDHRREKRGSRAVALVTVLIFCGVLLMMVLALFQTVRGELFLSQTYRKQTAAQYLAEVGAWDAVSQLELDPSWTAGFRDKKIPDVDGSYSVRFNTTGPPYLEDQSVNNWDGSSDSNYRGAGFVPRGCVSVVVTANVGGQQRTLEVLVRVGGGLYPAPAPIMASGRIDLRGDVLIDGRKGQADPTRVDANVHSNKADPEADIIVWDNNGTATIDGKVSVVAPNEDAISLKDCLPALGTAPGAEAQPIPNVDILSRISANSSAPRPFIQPSGTNVLRPPSAGQTALYHSGDLTVQGDLTLEGVKLYVDGKLHVNGSITGSGSVYVASSTTLQGDARISVSSPDSIALFSHGNVRLSGFNGTEYMESLAANNSSIRQNWDQLSTNLREYDSQLSSPGVGLGNVASLDSLAQQIGGTSNGRVSASIPGGRTPNVTGRLMAQLRTQPDSTAKAKMMEKLQDLNDHFYSYVDGSYAENEALRNLLAGRIVKGGFDAGVDNFPSLRGGQRAEVKNLMRSYVKSIDYNHLGASYFQGVIFTHGSIYTDSEVTIQGAVSAYDDGSQQPVEIDGEEIKPGDLILQPLTRISFIEEFFKAREDDEHQLGPGGSRVLLWMSR